MCIGSGERFERFAQVLAECGIAADQVPRVANRLTRPPNSIGLSASDDSRLDAKIQVRGGKQRRFPMVERAFDSDTAARLLRLTRAALIRNNLEGTITSRAQTGTAALGLVWHRARAQCHSERPLARD
jgi:hypothetical protein